MIISLEACLVVNELPEHVALDIIREINNEFNQGLNLYRRRDGNDK